MLLLEDVYGRTHEQEAFDDVLWWTEGTYPVLHEADLGDADKTGYIGKWNLHFLGWLRRISVLMLEPVEIAYEHERGDTLYEAAWWGSDPSPEEVRIESFGIQRNDGEDEPVWRAEAVRLSDGRFEVRES